MAKVTAIVYSRGTAKIYLSDGTQSPKIDALKVNEWIEANK